MGTEAQRGDTRGVAEQKAREFISLLPLTLAVAGLPQTNPGTYLNEGQMDARATAIRAAYKISRQIIGDVVK
ncbi:hypothetical protein BH10PLA2_BH10PLA2_17350 [soil metagenome]